MAEVSSVDGVDAVVVVPGPGEWSEEVICVVDVPRAMAWKVLAERVVVVEATALVSVALLSDEAVVDAVGAPELSELSVVDAAVIEVPATMAWKEPDDDDAVERSLKLATPSTLDKAVAAVKALPASRLAVAV